MDNIKDEKIVSNVIELKPERETAKKTVKARSSKQNTKTATVKAVTTTKTAAVNTVSASETAATATPAVRKKPAGQVKAAGRTKLAKKVETAAAEPNLSHERADVARRVLELSETIDEAIVYMRSKLPVFAVSEDARDYGIGISAAILKDIGEGLISLANAADALAVMEKTPDEDSVFLDTTYNTITGTVDTMIDAYIDNRAWDYAKLASSLHSSFKEYSVRLSRCYRGMAIN